MCIRHFCHLLCISLLMTSAAVAQSTAKNDPIAAGSPSAPSPSNDAPAANPFGGPGSGSALEGAPNGEINQASPSKLDSYRKEHGPNSAEGFIRMQMGQPTTQIFVEETLDNAVRILGETHEIPIVIDRRALEEIGITQDVPVTISLKDVKLRSFLHLMLMNLGLTYAIKDEVLMITTEGAVKNYATVQTYSLPESLASKSEQVLQILKNTVEPELWEYTDGSYSIAMIDSVLIVKAPEPVLEQVIDFFQKLEGTFKRNP